MKPLKLAKLTAHSWVGTSAIGAVHTYGDIHYWDHHEERLRTPLTAARAIKVNRDRRNGPDGFLHQLYKVGDPCGDYYSVEEVVYEASAFFDKEENRRGCDALILEGDEHNPGEVIWSNLDEELVLRLNDIAKQYRALNDENYREHEQELDALADEWKSLIQAEPRPPYQSKWAVTVTEEDEEPVAEKEEQQQPSAEPTGEIEAACWSYPNQLCPDCGEKIPDTDTWGDECENCGHVWVDPFSPEVEQATAQAKKEDSADLPAQCVIQRGNASRFIKPSQYPTAITPLTLHPHVTAVSGHQLSNASTETFYMAVVDITDDATGEDVGDMKFGCDGRFATYRKNEKGITRLVLTAKELWAALQPVFDEVDANQEHYLAQRFNKDDPLEDPSEPSEDGDTEL